MKYFTNIVLLVLCLTDSFAQDKSGVKESHVAAAVIQPNKHIVFARTPVTSNNPGNATQSFKGDDFIYGRVYFSQSLKDALFLEKNNEGVIPIDIFVEDLANHSSLYISLELTEEEMDKTYFDFDILPDPDHCLRSSKEFEKGRFSYFITPSALENKHPVFKFTVGDATGYISVDFSGVNLQQVKARDYEAYKKSQKTKGGEEMNDDEDKDDIK